MNARIRDYCLRRGCSVFEVEGGLEYLVRTWERTAVDVSRGYPGLLAQQFVSDLRIRQLLHEVWPLAFAQEREEFGPRLDAADALFMEHTTAVEVPVGASIGSGGSAATQVGGSARWWENREPKVRDEDW